MTQLPELQLGKIGNKCMHFAAIFHMLLYGNYVISLTDIDSMKKC